MELRLLENVLCSEEAQLVRGKQRFAWSSAHPSGESKRRNLGWRSKTGSRQSCFMAVYCSAPLGIVTCQVTVPVPGDGQTCVLDSDFLYQTRASGSFLIRPADSFISERRGGRTVALADLVWELLVRVKMRKCSPRKEHWS